jgi:hypothetical protein
VIVPRVLRRGAAAGAASIAHAARADPPRVLPPRPRLGPGSAGAVADAAPRGAVPRARALRTSRAEAAAPSPFPAETARCEAALLDELARVLDDLRRAPDELLPRPPSAAALGAALAELERAERDGWLAAPAAARRRRLLALSNAAANLGALLDQRRRGLLPDAALDARRAAILGRLADFFGD